MNEVFWKGETTVCCNRQQHHDLGQHVGGRRVAGLVLELGGRGCERTGMVGGKFCFGMRSGNGHYLACSHSLSHDFNSKGKFCLLTHSHTHTHSLTHKHNHSHTLTFTHLLSLYLSLSFSVSFIFHFSYLSPSVYHTSASHTHYLTKSIYGTNIIKQHNTSNFKLRANFSALYFVTF